MNPQSLTRRAALLVATLAVAAGTGWSAPAPKSGILHYEVQAQAPNQPAQKMTMTVWFKGENARQEVTTPRGKQVMISSTSGSFIMMPGGNEAMKMPRAKGSPFGEMATIKQGKKVGSEKVAGYQADIYEKTVDIKNPRMPQGRRSPTASG